MPLLQALIDARLLLPAARESLNFPAPAMTNIVTDPASPGLTEGNAWLLCIGKQAEEPMTVLACWCLTIQQAIDWLIKGELITRCAELRRRSEWVYLVLIGQPIAFGSFQAKRFTTNIHEPEAVDNSTANVSSSNFSWRALQGALTSIQEYGVSIVYAANDADLGPTLLWLAERDRAPKKLTPLREAAWLTPGEELLLTIPGIGPERLQMLMAYGESLGAETGRPYTVLEALCDLLDMHQDIPGIPKTVQEHARVALGLEQWTEPDSPAQPSMEYILKLEARPKQPGKPKKRRSTKQNPAIAQEVNINT